MNSALFYVDQAGKILHAENSETVLTAWEGAHLDDILSPVYRAISFRKVMQDMSLRDDRYCTIVFEVNLESVKRTVAMQLSISFVEKDIHLVILEEYKMDEFSITLDGNGKIKSCGGNSESFFGYEEKEMETVGLLALFGMDQQEFDELVKNEKNRNLTGRHKNGQTFYLNANVRKKSFIGTCMTILKLTKVNPKLETVFVLDSTGKVESFSEVIFNLLVGSDAELNGKDFSSLVTLNEEEKMISSDNGRDPKRRRLNMEGKKEDFSFREGKCTRTFLGTIKHEDGSPIPVQIEFYSFINEKGDKKSVIKMRRSLMKTSKFYGKWEIGEKLGSGNGGKVKAVRHVDTGKRAAVKIIKKKDLNEKDDAEKVKKESEIMMLLSHSNIVQLYEVLETEKELMIVMELVEGGMDLSEYTKKRGDFSESAAREIFKQILQAIHYCHSKQIFHRDIKHANILVNDKNEVRVIDFGLSRTIENGYLTTYCGTLAYSAPEMILGKKYKGSHIDVWSLGVVFFTLISGGSYPFDLISEILTPKSYTIPKGISDHCRDLIERMLESDCEKRISLSEILSHPWFAEETKPIQENPS